MSVSQPRAKFIATTRVGDGLAERAKQLGWSDVVVVDDDLAISGDGVKRPGFERLLLAICEGQAGTVLTIEASRLARNGRDLAHAAGILWSGQLSDY